MHRSGSSMVANLLQRLGMSLGPFELLAATEHNKYGHFEAVPFYKLDQELQARVFGFGEDVPSASDVLSRFRESEGRWPVEVSAIAGDMFERGRELLDTLVASGPISGFKDPRTPLLWPFWGRLLAEASGVRTIPLILLRSPHEVAMSIFMRNPCTLSYAAALDAAAVHLKQMKRILEGWSGESAIVRHDPRVFAQDLRRAAETCGLPWSDEALARVYDPSCKHHESAAVAHEAQELFEQLTGLKPLGPGFENLARLEQDAIKREGVLRALLLDAHGAVQSPAGAGEGALQVPDQVPRGSTAPSCDHDDCRRQTYAYQREIAQYARRIERLLLENNDCRTAFEQQQRQQETCLAELRHVKSERDQSIQALATQIRERDRAVRVLSAQVAEMQNSRAWKAALFLRKVRGSLAPPNSRRARALRRLAKVAILPVRRIRRKRTPAESPDAVACSGVPDESRRLGDGAGKRILLVSYYCPTRAHAGGLRILDLYRMIRANSPAAQLDLYTKRRPAIDWSYDAVEEIFDNIYDSDTEDLTVAGLLNQCPARPHYDVIDFQYHESARHLDKFRRLGAKMVFTPMESLARCLFIDAKGALSRRNRLPLKNLSHSVKVAARELALCHKADEVICVSKSDAAFLRSVSRSKKVCFLETGISGIEFRSAMEKLSSDPAPERKANTVLYVAYFGSETNVLALRWYLEHVHPRVRSRTPDSVLRVVGRGDLSPFSSFRDASIEFVGEVPSIAPYIEQAKVGIAPALGGAGFRGKINQYAIFGVPSVASSIAVSGLAYRPGVDICVAEGPEDFAEQCVRLLTDDELNRQMGQRARQTALLNYTWESNLDAIKNIYGLNGAIR